MATIEEIKQRIDDLDSATFQALCDAYLLAKGYRNIVALGKVPGVKRTKKGTPDTYFCIKEAKYVFVEYTVQKENLFSKITKDIEKCLNVSKTGVPHEKILEIIYCHTSSNITPAQDIRIKTTCNDLGVRCIIYGIDVIAFELFKFHNDIVIDYLGLTLNTGQIQTIEEYIKEYNSSNISAPIDTDFILRSKEIDEIDKAFEKSSVVLLVGKAGVGKTRLGVHYATLHKSDYKLLCIHDNGLALYEDIIRFMGMPGKYFILIDDANQLSELHHIVKYTLRENEHYDVKVLITVRDYAVKQVVEKIGELVFLSKIEIPVFQNNEIRELLESSLGIRNSEYLNRIVRIAEGNARIAVISGMIAKETGYFESINDVSELYENYFGKLISQNTIISDTDKLLTLGLISFLSVIRMDKTNEINPILARIGLEKDSFDKNYRSLHKLELVDVYFDRAVRISDQAFSNYILKYIYLDEKLIRISDILEICFDTYQEKVVYSLNTMLSLFNNGIVFDYIKVNVIEVWNKFKIHNRRNFLDFVKIFYRFNPTDTLLLIFEAINETSQEFKNFNDIDSDVSKHYFRISDKIIELLGGFAFMNEESEAIDLMLRYMRKKPDLYLDVYHVICSDFSISKYSGYQNCKTQIILIQKLIEYSDNWENEIMVRLFLDVADHFLKLEFSPSENTGKKQITYYTIPIESVDGSISYRRLIWESLLLLSSIEYYSERVIESMFTYAKHNKRESNSVFLIDLDFLCQILTLNYSSEVLSNCILVEKIFNIEHFTFEDKYVAIYKEYFTNKDYAIYKLISEYRIDYNNVSYEDGMAHKKQEIIDFVQSCNIEKLKNVIDVCQKITDCDTRTRWNITISLKTIFDAVVNNGDVLIELVKYYLEKGTPFFLNPQDIMKSWFCHSDAVTIFNKIHNCHIRLKNDWLYAYFFELPSQDINEHTLVLLYDFLNDTSDAECIGYHMRSIDFLHKFERIDQGVFLKGCAIIFRKIEYSSKIIDLYFESDFLCFKDNPENLILMFDKDFPLFESIYYLLIGNNTHIDYEGKYLRTMYLKTPETLQKYIMCLANGTNYALRENERRSMFFFELENFIDVFVTIFEGLLENTIYAQYELNRFLETILLSRNNIHLLQEKQDSLIKECIKKYSNDVSKLVHIFYIVAKLDNSRKCSYWMEFLKFNQDFEDFRKLPITPMSLDYTGSAVPIYQNRITFFEELIHNLVGVRFLKHKKHLEDYLMSLNKTIEMEKINDLISE